MEGFKIDLRTFLGLAMPNQYSQIVISIQNPLTFVILIYSTYYCTIW